MTPAINIEHLKTYFRSYIINTIRLSKASLQAGWFRLQWVDGESGDIYDHDLEDYLREFPDMDAMLEDLGDDDVEEAFLAWADGLLRAAYRDYLLTQLEQCK